MPSSRGAPPRRRAATSRQRDVSTRRRSRCSRTTGDPGTTGPGCCRPCLDRRRRSSTPSRRRRATRAGWPGSTRPGSLRRSSAQPDLRPEDAERPIDERLGDMGRDLARAVREEALAVVVEAGDLREAGLAEQALEAARRVAHLGDAVLVARVAALEAVLPVRLDEQEAAAGTEGPPSGVQDEVGMAAVVERVVEQRRVETALE